MAPKVMASSFEWDFRYTLLEASHAWLNKTLIIIFPMTRASRIPN